MDLDGLRAMMASADAEKLADWERSVPIGDLLNDRWQRAQRLGWGDQANLYDGCLVLQPVEVGAGTWVGPWTVLDGSGGGLRIGAHCDISAGVHIYTHDTVLRVVSRGAAGIRSGPVSIGDHTYVGPSSVVAANVTIGSQCVIGAGSFVNRDVPDRTIVFGSPAVAKGHVVGEGADTRLAFFEGDEQDRHPRASS